MTYLIFVNHKNEIFQLFSPKFRHHLNEVGNRNAEVGSWKTEGEKVRRSEEHKVRS